MPKLKPAPKDPLRSVPTETSIINRLLSLGMDRELAPDVAVLARALHRGITGKDPDFNQKRDLRRSLYMAGYTLGTILFDMLPSEDTPCAPQKTSSTRQPKPLRSAG